MLTSDLRPRGVSRSTQPSRPLNLRKDPLSTCMKCGAALSGVTKFPQVLDDLSIIFNCGHVLCNKCIHLNDYSSVNRGRPAHCRQDFQCSICGLMSPPLTLPNHVRVCERRYTKQFNGECKCEICVFQKTNPDGIQRTLNNIAYCGVHRGNIMEYFCFQCGKHLCPQCYEFHKADFTSPDHTITRIADDNLRIEDTMYHSVVIHGNLVSLQDEAQKALEDHLKDFKNVRNSLGCYFVSIINAAIGRFCQLQSAIQLEEEKLKKSVSDIKKNLEDAKRRIVIGKEMDDFARSRVLMPEQFVANTYKVSAQKIFREAIEFHNVAIQDVKAVKSHKLQFNSKIPTDEAIKKVCTVLNGFTVSNSKVIKQYEIPPFAKLLNTQGGVIIDTSEMGMKLNISDFSTHEGAAKMREDGFAVFQNAVQRCGLNGDLSALHSSLIPIKQKEKTLDQAGNPNGNLSVLTDPKQPSPSTSNASAPSSSRASASSSTSLVGSPNLPSAEDRSKKQEHLLNLIRSAGNAEQPATSALVNELRKQSGISHRAEGKRLSVPNKRYAVETPPLPPVTIVTRGSKYDRMKEVLMAKNPEIDQMARTPISLPPPRPTTSQPSTSTCEPSAISISTEFMSKFYNSLQFKALSPDHQFYVLKQAQIMSDAEEQRRRNPNFSKTDHIVILQINQVKLQTLITKLYNVEKSGTPPFNLNFQPQRSLAKLPFHISTEPLSRLSSNAQPSTSATPNANGNAPAPTPPPRFLPTMAEIKQEVVEEEIDKKPDVEELKRQMRNKKKVTIVTIREEEKPILIEPPTVATNINGNSCPPRVVPKVEPDVEPTQQNKPVIQDRPDGRLILRLPRPPPKVAPPVVQAKPVPPPVVQAKPVPPPVVQAKPVPPPVVQAKPVPPPVKERREVEPVQEKKPETSSSDYEDYVEVDDNESVRSIDGDDNHKWCYCCNDNKDEAVEEEKGICPTCPRVFHKSCTIPRLRVEWDEDDNWQCVMCMKTPVKKENESKTLMTDRNRFLCQKVLMICFGTTNAHLLLRSYAEPHKTLEVVSQRLEEDHADSFATVDEFIEALNDVLINSATYNLPFSTKGIATQRVTKLFYKAVKANLPEYLTEVWEFSNVYCNYNTATKRKQNTSRGGSGGKRRK